MINLIAFIGPKSSGKSTLANLMPLAWTRTSFSEPIKVMVESLLLFQGVDRHTIYKMIYGDLKETPTPFLNNRSPRHVMQTLGTEWRELIDRNLWIDIWTRTYGNKKKIIIDDLRFFHEAERIKFLNGKIIRISRPEIHNSDFHISELEQNQITADFTIYNDSTPENMLTQLKTYLGNNL